MQDTIAVANEIKNIAGCDNLHYLQVDFNDPHFDQKIDEAIPMPCDYAFFFSVYRTKELTQRDELFRYILQKTTKGVFFEGHAHPKIDTIEYYEWLFDSLQCPLYLSWVFRTTNSTAYFILTLRAELSNRIYRGSSINP